MIQIRQADLLDLDSILNLWVEFTGYLAEIEPDFFSLRADSTEIYREVLKAKLCDTKVLILVVTSIEEVIGYQITTICYPGEVFESEPYGHVSDLYIKEEYRRQKLGKRLLGITFNWLYEQKIKRVNVTPFVCNDKALDFWQEMGFSSYTMGLKLIL